MATMIRAAGSRLRTGLAILGGVTLASTYANYMQNEIKKKKLSKDRVLHLDLNMAITEASPTPFEEITNGQRPPMSVRQLTDAIRWASKDPHVKGILCTMGGGGRSIAITQEIRDSLLEFRRTQKDLPKDEQRVCAVAGDTFGEAGQGTVDYYLATGFDAIYLQPSGLVGMIGIHSESFFLKNLLAKIGIMPQFFKYYEYKNAANQFTEDKFTPEHKEQTERLLGSLYGQICKGIAAARGMDESTVRKIVDDSPIGAADAVKRGLVDGILYYDQVLDKLGVKDEVCELQDFQKYWKEANRNKNGGKPPGIMDQLQEAMKKMQKGKDDEEVIALVTASGNVVRGKGQRADMGADKVVAAVRAAAKDTKVKAIVVRVDTRGGSAVASDTIRRELERAREIGKPVIVSMSTYAASGGYYIATGADKIVAQPGTITGSIGVVVGKFTLSKLLGDIGVGVGEVDFGKNASSQSSNTPWNEEQQKRTEQIGLNFYTDFLGHVSKARGMTVKEVDDIARGRVWTGEQGLKLGLVDKLGGLKEAHELAAELAPGLKKKLPDLVDYPKKKKPIEELIELLGGKTDASTAMESMFSMSFEELRQAVSVLAEASASIRALHAGRAGTVSLTHDGPSITS